MDKNFKSMVISYISDFVIALGLSFSLIYAFTSTFKMHYVAKEVFIATFITLGIYSILFSNKLFIKIFSIISTIIVSIVVFLFFINPLLFKVFIDILTSFFKVIDKEINRGAILSLQNQKVIFLILIISISLCIYFFVIKKFNFYILLIGGVSIFAGQWMIEYFVIYFSFYIYLFFILICYLKYIYLRNIKGDKDNLKGISISFVLYSITICGVVLISAYYLSERENPIELSLINNKERNVNRSIRNVFNNVNDSYFNIKSTGFSEDSSRLGGNVSIDNTIVMEVESPENGIYLKGAVRDRYTGYSWENNMARVAALGNINEIYDFNDDLFELLQGSKIISDEINVIEEGFEKKSVKITYKKLGTKTIFIPSKVDNLIFKPEESLEVFADSYGILSSKNYLHKNFEYTANLYKINKSNEEIYNLLRKSGRWLYDEYILDNSIIPSNNQDIISFSETSTEIYNKYLQLPSNLPQRVKNLAFEITSSANNDYDRAKAIEEYLYQNYEYTLEPGNTPEDRDFVDYFLFDLKKGYCTYYASAMTVLARSIGIPARYVEGYVLPRESSSDGVYKVRNKEAHAWVEVYFEGFGWMPFEPTATFLEGLYDESEEEILNAENDEAEIVQNNTIEDNESTSNIIEEESSGNLKDKDDNIKEKPVLFILSSILIIISLLLWVLAVPYFKRRIIIYRLKKYPSKNRVIKIYKRFLRIFSLQGFKIKIGETPLQYAQRIDETLGFNEISFRSITDIFNKASYSNSPINDEEIQLIIDFYNTIPDHCKRKRGRVRYFIFNNILGVI